MPDRLQQLLRRIDDTLSDDRGMSDPGADHVLRPLMDELATVAASLSGDELRILEARDGGLARQRRCLADLYGRYIWSRENREAGQLLEHGPGGDAGFVALMSGDFGARIYRRVRDMFEHIDFSTCRRFVMVGCGPLPGTLFNVLESSEVPEIVGLDIDAPTVASVRRLAERFGLERLSVEHCAGAAYDYGPADLVYVANLVRGKAGVLRRIADTVRPGTRVILRDPFAGGGLFAESGLEGLDPRYTVSGEGEADTRFLSKHVFLAVSDT